MTIAEADIEKQVAHAIEVTPHVPVPTIAQVLVVAQSENLADIMLGEMKLDAGVKGQVISGTLSSVLEARTQDWSNVDFVVFEVSEESADLLAISQLKSLPDTKMHCIAVTRLPVTRDMSQRFMTAGVHELMSLKGASDEGGTVPAMAQQTATDLETGGNVSVVLRARGGVGATTVAVNLAASQAAKSQAGRIALVDFDIQNGAVALAVDLPDSSDTTQFVKGEAIADVAFLERAMQRHSSGMDVLTAPDVFAPLTAITPQMIACLLGSLKARYDHIIVDMPQAVVDWVSPVLASASRVIVLSDMTLPSLKRTKRLIDLIGEEHMTLPIDVVVNFEKRPVFASASHKEAAHLLGRSLDHWIPSDPKAARRASDVGVPVVIGTKRSRSARAIEGLGKYVFKTEERA